MFSEYRIHPALLLLLYCLLCSAGEEVVRLQELEGNTVTIHTGLTGVQSDAHILWFYGPENADIKIVNSQIIRGEIITDYYSERFRDRLQLNRTSGSLTIRNISREDSGVYKLHIITGISSVWSFSVDVYAPVSKPVIRNQAEKRSVSLRESCSPLCSVENGKDVSLSWYEEKERISSISSSDSSERLYLPLNKTNPDCSTYTCVAANPVSTQTAQLNITNICCKSVYKHDKLNYAVKSTSPDSNEAHKDNEELWTDRAVSAEFRLPSRARASREHVDVTDCSLDFSGSSMHCLLPAEGDGGKEPWTNQANLVHL
ncbi:pregnancy-specific beta-1-glycoprotein 1-like [Pygocentrus nattereri]|uniref:pregnancy-specific beta-1-glycoprotein 1-like n=1 Tax=Pygocentrus nattereri TaxID=42514 RepID=UPI0018914E06|nr:pregnancy-specific beta-1-glycoprotein 1-like [Pygocentrus nattereri]